MPPRPASPSSATWLWIAATASLVVSLTPAAGVALYPFRLFTTWVHESSHAVATVLVGGHVSSIAIRPDGSGVTYSLVPDSRLRQGIVASAGYCGSALIGCVLIAATRVERRAHTFLAVVGGSMLVTLLLWIRNPFGAAVVLAWSVAFLVLARRRLGRTAQFLVGLLAVQVALNAVYDIRVLYLVRGPSDAATMAALFLLPAWWWATSWMLLAVGMLGATIWTTRARR